MQPAIIVKEVIKLLRSSLPTTISIVQDIDPKTGVILADPNQIRSDNNEHLHKKLFMLWKRKEESLPFH